ncbi:hypothetical protein [Streptomyces alkaliterrae]|uniref:Uncharacterized protein n=1 Tax=Streptomyces alkaliterrae TaxID=2213162 RepID=A0A7W3WRD6_9ACTN|nr:hypothetical protein [Streptomyces alkaliterrae]MBB1257104.1 hypothetical protein [Streptomyces alkaliterrae]MBB1257293.1 hypothetical protein [Streptomyces alkaliterrae]
MPTSTKKRSRTRRAGESAYGLLLLGRNALVALVAAVLLVAGFWTSWDDARHAMFPKDGTRGTMTVEKCADGRCTGPFVADSGGSAPDRVGIAESAVRDVGDRPAVALKPGTEDVVRTGIGGVLHTWIPLGGALVLAALVLAGGLRLRRTGWAMGLLGGAVMVGAFFTV